MFETASYEESLKEQNKIYVDVRTPKEYAKETIPGAVNIPVLLNDERVVVGTLYKQKDPESAKLAGVQFISKRLPEIFAEFQKLNKEYGKVYVFCSRGGYRSSSLVSFIYSLGIHIFKSPIDNFFILYYNVIMLYDCALSQSFFYLIIAIKSDSHDVSIVTCEP